MPPALLDALSRELVESKFDLRRLTRTILRSRVYQLSGKPNETNENDEDNFSHAIVRTLQAEQLLDALSQATLVHIAFSLRQRLTAAQFREHVVESGQGQIGVEPQSLLA